MKKRKILRNAELVTIITALMFGLIGIFSYGLYEDLNNKTLNKLATKKPVTETLDLNSAKVKALYNRLIDVRLCNAGTTWDYEELASGATITIAEMITSDKIDLIFRQFDIDGLIPDESYDQTAGTYKTITISKEQFDNAALAVFKDTINIENDDIKNFIYQGYKFNYDSTEQQITGEGIGIGCEMPGLDSKLIGVNNTTNGLELIVQVNTAVFDPQNEIMENTNLEFYVYKYTFTKQGNNYYLNSIAYNLE